MARGAGSNDIGLDRGQPGSRKVIRFQRSGPKILMIEENLTVRHRLEKQDPAAEMSEAVEPIGSTLDRY